MDKKQGDLKACQRKHDGYDLLGNLESYALISGVTDVSCTLTDIKCAVSGPSCQLKNLRCIVEIAGQVQPDVML